MFIFNTITFLLVMIGAFNWGFIGLFNWNFVNAVFGFGWASRAIYIIVAASALWLLIYALFYVFLRTEGRQARANAKIRS